MVDNVSVDRSFQDANRGRICVLCSYRVNVGFACVCSYGVISIHCECLRSKKMKQWYIGTTYKVLMTKIITHFAASSRCTYS